MTRLRFDRFVAWALYDPQIGYYAAARSRVGRGGGTDFYTASSVPLFGELIAAAAAGLVRRENASEYTFVEIGAESPGGVLAGVPHPFAAVRVIRLNETLELSGRCIVFSNELFDAQPFRRFRRRGGHWTESWVRKGPAGWEEYWTEIEPDEALPSPLPGPSPDDPSEYHLDAPTGAVSLIRAIARQPWEGLFLAADYGKSWQELAHEVPQGTARAYHRHRQSNDLLANPGEQDLTCHVCWDWLQAELTKHGFEPPEIESQEAFFVRHASPVLQQVLESGTPSADPRRRAIAQLLHPSLMGRKFQLLHAFRG